ncbi:anaerobic dimethyl sulfoxide reductase, A subunit, DmsA/YnfE family [Denitrovibrio acetiphilus DSM 12809]|uniref:Anaerobic dimethyl sulfoxide reductase, A subunit, DmsA/YnfE family n=1 Tax=Denitrovibrio acetiphilus (strain DSM 12809 / NBRC 114555 / N2460) TaxID=522772 RepID=D4H2E4_DENA2|nr:DMSO/selenate family reductase complex A subunit [Denitrovibrio acetiphilus]ADD68935.1 anaerobic dimethyl sulfoxide reductase, A subunit, DmsA/YnfE family [Denitrovibrio acetiphilus DSM 12809]
MSVSGNERLSKALDVSRRTFMKWSALLGAAATVGCGSLDGSDSSGSGGSDSVIEPKEFDYDKAVWSACNVNCGSNCPLKLYVKDGVVVRVSTDNETEDVYGSYGANYQMRSCVRGRSVRQRIYNTDRLKYPMRRVAGSPRGAGQYERITWEEAINEISAKMQSVKSNYGPDSFYIQYATGTIDASIACSWPPASTPMARLHNLWGGWLNHYSDYSTSQITASLCLLEGSSFSNNTITDAVNSNLVVLWGNNPANTRMGSGRHWTYHLQKAKEANPNLKFIVVDPFYTDTALALEADWISIRPGTDAALVAGMTHYLLSENLLDEDWIDERSVGWSEASFANVKEVFEGEESGYAPAYDKAWGDTDTTEPPVAPESSYKSYLLGLGADGVVKDTAWASNITGIPEKTIQDFAKQLLNQSPAMVIQGWGPQRNSLGGNNCRAIGLITILTKNIGITGGGTAAREGAASVSIRMNKWVSTFPANPVPQTISNYAWPQAIKDNTVMTGKTWGVRGLPTPDDALPQPIKFIWNYAGNCMLNQHGDINNTMEMYKDESLVECIVTIDNYFTPSAMISDYILPDCTNFEQNDISTNSGGNTCDIKFQNKAIEPMFECKTIYEMMSLIAAKLGIEGEFTEGRTQEEWLEYLFDQSIATYGDQGVFTAEKGQDTFAKCHEKGLIKHYSTTAVPSVAFEDFVSDPSSNRVSTPSGKFEIFSKRLYNLSHQWSFPAEYQDGKDKITALPEYYAAWDGYEDPTISTYPFQVVGFHHKQRTHSTYYNTEWNREASQQAAWINTEDAQNLGISHGDIVDIYNDRGRVRIVAKVTSRVMPGVIGLPQGAWYNPGGKWYNSDIEHVGTLSEAEIGNTSVVDHGGCMNVLTSLRPGPISKGNCQHSVLASIEKVG